MFTKEFITELSEDFIDDYLAFYRLHFFNELEFVCEIFDAA